MTKDWTGNTSIYACNHRGKEEDVAQGDFYATHPESIQLFLKKCQERNFILPEYIWEPACGQGHISKELQNSGYKVLSSDLYDRGFGWHDIDFLKITRDNINDYFKPYLKCIFTNPPYACFSFDTEIKTRNGWKFFKDLTNEDEVLSLNKDTQLLEWSKINNFYLYDIEDEIVHFNSGFIDILVTKNHRMYAFDFNNKIALKNNDLIHAEDVKNDYTIPRFGYKWNGNNVKTMIIKGCYVSNGQKNIWHNDIEINMNDWLRFFGLWLADGYCRHTKNSAGNKRYTVGIKQHERTKEKVINILKEEFMNSIKIN